jgi:predicted amidophosphoribosyltransferase
MRKVMAAGGVTFIGKSQRPVCPRCRQSSRPGARCCTSCGAGLLSVVKSAAQQSHDHYMAMYRREADPGRREVYWQLANPELFGSKGGRAS